MIEPGEGIIASFALGSNLGDRSRNIDAAKVLMATRMGTLVSMSKIYESPSWGYTSNHLYYNCCLAIRTVVEPPALMEMALQIERELGRIRQEGGYGDRIIDIDLLLYGEVVVDHPGLIVPHPNMEMRRFVLVPLAEIVPDQLHPVTGLTVAVPEHVEYGIDHGPEQVGGDEVGEFDFPGPVVPDHQEGPHGDGQQ